MLVVELDPQLDSQTSGVKAANLGKAMANGCCVPPGFVVTRNALGIFLRHTGLKTLVEEFVSHSMLAENMDRAAEFNDLCRQIRAAPIPEPLAVAVAKMAEPLLAKAPGGVAVRSSGTHEDSATASFAGIYQSYLGIRSMDELWVAIKQCWCSAWTPQATVYAHRMGVTPDPDSMAVLIQQLVVADSAGVLFTANPRTGNPWQFILESTFGLAQELVGSVGDVAADRFVLEWNTGRIIERHIAQKPTACVPSKTGVHVVPVPEERRMLPSLSDTLATHLAKLALDIDRVFECRVDIEWAVADDEIHIVQVRPITALPAFFPHHLPSNESDKRWERTWPYWYFPLGGIEGKVVPPLYRDLSYTEMFDRYQLGPIDLHPYRFVGIEADFNGHRYRAGQHRWPQVNASPEQLEAYLHEYEPALRQMWLEAKGHKFPAISFEVIERHRQARSVKEQIEVLLWARDTDFDIRCMIIGPPATLHGICNELFEGFLSKHLPGFNTAPLRQAHHPDLDPYYPHVQVQEAEALAKTVGEGPIRQAFATMDVQSIFQYLVEHPDASLFARAYSDYCEQFGMVPPRRFDEIIPNEKIIHYSVIQVIRDTLLGKSAGVAAHHQQVMRRRQECEAELRQLLAKQEPDLVPRFEQLLDWVFFWLPALNDRAWASVPRNLVHGLWTDMCRKLQAAGLVETPTDMRYFTCEDLVTIAQTGDIGEGRRIWQRRRLEYEHDDRLQAPLYLGKAPDDSANSKPLTNGSTAIYATQVSLQDKRVALKEEKSSSAEDGTRVVIRGRGLSPGNAKGIAHKIEMLHESGSATNQHILILTKTVKPTNQYTALLLSLVLRVQGIIIVQSGNTYTHHIAQIARECGVPVLEISPAEIDYIPDSAELIVNASEGIVTVVDP